jgi:hypothetical protein
MPWALNFAGNDTTLRRKIGPFPLATNFAQSMRIDITLVHAASTTFQAFLNSTETNISNDNFFVGCNSTGVIYFWNNGNALNSNVTPVVGQEYVVSITINTAKTVGIQVNGGAIFTRSYPNLSASLYGQLNVGATANGPNTVYRDPFLGELRRVETWVGGVKTGDYTNNTGSGISLTNTLSTNTADQIGTWPTNDSEWVFYSSGATYQLTALGGTFSYAGAQASLLRRFRLQTLGATYAYSGASANLTYVPTGTIYTLTALGGSFAYSGGSANVRANRKLVAQGGSYNYSGGQASLLRRFRLVANGGAYTYAGGSANLTYNQLPGVYRLTALGATYTYTGGIATLTATGVTPMANPGAYVIQAYVGGTQTISAKIGGRQTINAMVAI